MDETLKNKLLEEHKVEFCRFALTYFNSFGWTIQNEISLGIWQALDPLREPMIIVAIDHPQENFPQTKQLKTLGTHLLIVSPEFSPISSIKGAKNRKVTKYTASGMKFCYVKFME